MRIWDYWLPLALIRAYRLVPKAVRCRLTGNGAATSHLGLQWVREGRGWAGVFEAVRLSGDSTRPPMPGKG